MNSGTPWPKTCAYLKSVRIDPATVCDDGVTADGYWLLILDRRGRRQISEGHLKREFREWPSLIVGQGVIALMREDARDRNVR